jgi:hypothetical protein
MLCAKSPTSVVGSAKLLDALRLTLGKAPFRGGPLGTSTAEPSPAARS